MQPPNQRLAVVQGPTIASAKRTFDLLPKVRPPRTATSEAAPESFGKQLANMGRTGGSYFLQHMAETMWPKDGDLTGPLSNSSANHFEGVFPLAKRISPTHHPS